MPLYSSIFIFVLTDKATLSISPETWLSFIKLKFLPWSELGLYYESSHSQIWIPSNISSNEIINTWPCLFSEVSGGQKVRNTGSGSNNLILYGLEKTLKVTIRMNEMKERNQVPGAIFYKDDEARFNQQHTLKLKTFSKYNVTMEVEPAMEITWVNSPSVLSTLSTSSFLYPVSHWRNAALKALWESDSSRFGEILDPNQSPFVKEVKRKSTDSRQIDISGCHLAPLSNQAWYLFQLCAVW